MMGPELKNPQTSLPKWSILLQMFVLLLATGYLLAPIFEHLSWFGGWDQGYFHGFDETARRSLKQWGEFPLWNPYHCGGRTLVGHVANVHLHPFFWIFALPLGTAYAYKIYLVLHILAGMVGMWFYLGEKGALSSGRLFGAMVFGACGYFSWHFAGGHVSYFGLTLIPWIVICLDRSRKQWIYGVWNGLLLASVFLMAGAYSYPFVVLLVAIASIYHTIRDRSYIPFLAAAIAAVVSLSISAVKVLPVLSFTLEHSRPTVMLQSMEPYDIIHVLLSRSHQYGTWIGHHFVWPEYGAYIGYFGILFGVIGLVRYGGNRRHELIMLLIFVGLALGNHGWWSPYALLRKLPVYKDLRVPSRYMIFVVFYLALFGGLALSATERRLSARLGSLDRLSTLLPAALVARAGTILAVLIALLAGYEVTSWSQIEFGRTYNVEPKKMKHQPHYQGYVSNGQANAYLGPYWNVGVLNCYEEGANPMSKLLKGGKNRPQVYFQSPAIGSAKRTGWSPNSISVEATVKQAGLLLFNQNYDRHWHSTVGRVVDHKGLLAVKLPVGTHRVGLRYRPKPFIIGAWISSIAILLVLALLILLTIRRRRGFFRTLFPRVESS